MTKWVLDRQDKDIVMRWPTLVMTQNYDKTFCAQRTASNFTLKLC